MVKKYFLITSLISFSLLFFTCSDEKVKEDNGSSSSLNPAFSQKVKTTKAVSKLLEREVRLSGMVTADPDKTISYSPLIDGIVEKTYFSLGDKVKKGQVLIDLRSPELSNLQAELVSLESEIQIADRELKTAQELYANGMISERELLEARGKSLQTHAVLDKIKTDMAFFGTSKGRGTFSLTAPAGGYITYKNASAGSTVSPDNGPLFTIADLSSVWVVANVYAGELLFVKEGMEGEISSISYPGQVFRGKLNHISQVFDPDDKTLKARIILDNKDLKLKPEMSVIVKLKTEHPESYIAVPTDALIFDNNRYYLIVQDAGNNYTIRNVNLCGHNGEITYLSSGVEENEDVVVRNQLLIYSELKDK